MLERGLFDGLFLAGYLDTASRAMGFVAQIEHDDRYDLADECPQLVYALGEAVGAIAAAGAHVVDRQ
jgi:hypothetical protein